MENDELTYKMFVLVLYQLMPIQKGIQAQHVVTEYGEKYFHSPEYRKWASKDKTTILKSVGGSKEMQDAITQLTLNNINYAVFEEEDLYDKPTAICLLADNRVWDIQTYPDPSKLVGPSADIFITMIREYSDFQAEIGGDANIFLRSFLPNFKLAQ